MIPENKNLAQELFIDKNFNNHSSLNTELTGHGDNQRGANPRKPLSLGKAYVKP